MKQPLIAANSPVLVKLQPGTHFWCACGRSKTQPFCDGSHKGTGINPAQLKIDEETEAWLCRCKKSSNPPYCDGSHKEL